MEITNMTFVTLIVLCVFAVVAVGWLFKAMSEHDHIEYTTLDKPLKNAGKPWYNK